MSRSAFHGCMYKNSESLSYILLRLLFFLSELKKKFPELISNSLQSLVDNNLLLSLVIFTFIPSLVIRDNAELSNSFPAIISLSTDRNFFNL